ncbi:MAG: phosphate starvation-inducible protein PhoH, partial [Rhodospirillaceae bacterium]
MPQPAHDGEQTEQASVSEVAHLTCEFSNNTLMQELVGPHNANLSRLERRLGVVLHSRGNTVTVEGPAKSAAAAEEALSLLYTRLADGLPVEAGDVDGAARLAKHEGEAPADLTIR